ncbi:MAG: manganese catalase family protein [Clostridia bacterium]|nr:manganese catalase family protein [Clostridia bacterium]
MWIYEKKLQYPIHIKKPNPMYASIIISQLGGPDGELGAATRYLSQRFSMPYNEVIGILTDVGTEELAHVEMISTLLYQLTRDLTPEQIAKAGLDKYFVDHTTGVYPASAAGTPFTTAYIGVKGDVLADLNEDLAADATIPQAQPLSKINFTDEKWVRTSLFLKYLKNRNEFEIVITLYCNIILRTC